MNKTAKIISACGAFVLVVGLGVFAYISIPKEQDIPVASIATAAPTTVPPTEPPTTEPVILPVYDYVPSEEGMTGQAKALLKQNKDMIGWLKIEGTNVDYPVLKDPGEIPAGIAYYGGNAYAANEYYLHSDIDGSYKFAGSLYTDYRNNFGGIEDEQSENIIIYGHNMANNTMFGSIRRYRQDPSYFNKYPFIQFSSNYKEYDYVIVTCLITGGNWYSDFIYWDMEELDTEADFNYYMDCVREKQLVDTGIDVEYGDKLLTLSTCYADEDNSRFLIIARRLRDDETTDLATIKGSAAYNEAHKDTDTTEEQ